MSNRLRETEIRGVVNGLTTWIGGEDVRVAELKAQNEALSIRCAELEDAIIDICEHTNSVNIVKYFDKAAKLVGRENDYYGYKKSN